MNKRKLTLVRKKIDKIDNQIFNLIKQRTKLIQVIMNIKSLKKQIVDQKRISEILKKIKKKSISHSVDSKLTKKSYGNFFLKYYITSPNRT